MILVLIIAGTGTAASLGCGGSPSLPPLAEGPDAAQIPGKFVWHNLVTSDGEAARAFYGALFGWEFDIVADGKYSIISYEGRNLGGIIDTSKDGKPLQAGRWLSAVSVPNVDRTVTAIEEAGGEQLEAPIDVPGVGRVVTVRDPDGAVFHLLASSHGDPPDVDPNVHTWLWHELIANDPKRAVTFYERVFGYRMELLRKNPSDPYRVLWRSGGPRAGIIDNPFDTKRSAWIPYLRVEDPAALAKRVTELGGYVVIEPRADVRDGTLALVLDPSGAPVALQKWSPDMEIEP
jgi:hypothetical protein